MSKAGANSHPVPLLRIIYLVMNAAKLCKKAISNKNHIFIKKIGKNYCGIKNNAYLCIESNGDSTDAAGSANTKQERQ